MKELFTQPLDPKYRQEAQGDNDQHDVNPYAAPGLVRELHRIKGAGNGNQIVVYQEGADNNNKDQIVGAAIKVGMAYFLNSPMVDAEGKQKIILDAVQEKLNIKTHKSGKSEDVKTSFPIFEIIEPIVTSIRRDYEKLAIDGKILTKTDLDQQNGEISDKITSDVFRGEFDDSYDTTEEERQFALELSSYLGRVPQSEIKRKMLDAVRDRSSDRAEIDSAHQLHNRYSTLLRDFERTRSKKGNNLFFVPDYTTTMLLTSGREKEVLQNTAFSLDNEGVHIEQVATGAEDSIDIQWEFLSDSAPQKYGWLVYPGVLKNPDLLRSNLGVLRTFFPQVTNKIAKSPYLAGILSFQNVGRETRYNVAVKEAEQLKADFGAVGNLVESIKSFTNYIGEQKDRKTPTYAPHLRPNHIKKLLPPGADLIPYEREIVGFNKGRAKGRLELMRQRVEAAIVEAVSRGSSYLDEAGNPIQASSDRIAELRSKLESVNNEMERFDQPTGNDSSSWFK